MFNYEIGGNERKVDTSESFTEIAPNKTLFIQKLTDNEPLKPETVEGLKTVEEVFQHFKPAVEIDFEREDQGEVTETLRFSGLGDFGVKSLMQQSNTLSDLSIERDMYLNIIRQLKSNKTLKATLDNPETKEAFLSALKNFVTELEG